MRASTSRSQTAEALAAARVCAPAPALAVETVVQLLPLIERDPKQQDLLASGYAENADSATLAQVKKQRSALS